MTEPCIITVAITGSVPKKEDNPAVPVTVAEQIESTHEAFEAGAAIVHVHVRDAQQRPSSDPGKFAAFQDGVRKHCPGMIVQFSTGGRGRASEERGGMLYLRPDMASLATGSVNFPNMIYENHPELVHDLAQKMLDYDIKPEIEVFDLAMLYTAHQMAEAGMIRKPVHVQFVFGLMNALPPRRDILEFEVVQLAAQGADAGGDLDRGGHRPQPAGDEPVDPRDGRPLPHRARGQYPLRQVPAGRQQRRTRRPRGWAVRRIRPPSRNAGRGAADPFDSRADRCRVTPAQVAAMLPA